MDSPKIRLLIDMGTNKLRTALAGARKLVDSGVGGMKQKLSTLEVPPIKTGGFMSSLNGLKIMALAAITALSIGIGHAISAGMEAGATKTSFEVLAGKGPGDKLHASLKQFAEDSIFGNEVFKDSQTMLGFGITVDKILPRLKQLGDLSMGNKDKLGSLTLAFSQTTAAGRLMGQDALQYINAGFNPLMEISKMTGQSMASLKKKMEDGAISAAMVGKAIDHATGPMGIFYQMTEKIGKTSFGQWQALQGQLEGIVVQLGTALLPVASQVFGYIAQVAGYLPGLITMMEPAFALVGIGLQVLVDWIKQTINVIMTLGQWIRDNRVWLSALTGAVLAGALAWKAYQGWQVLSYMWTMRQLIGQALLATSTGLLTTALTFLNAAFIASPIGWIVLGVAALTAGIIYAYQKFDWFRGAVKGTWEVIKVFGDMLYDLTIGQILNLLKGLKGLGVALVELFSGNFKEAVNAGKDALKDLSGYNTLKQVYTDGSNIGGAWKTGYQEGIDGFARDQLSPMTADSFRDFYNKMGQKAGKGFADGVLGIMAMLPGLMVQTMNASVGAINPLAGFVTAFANAKGLNPEKVEAGGTMKMGGTKTEAAPASKVTGSASQTRNITIRIDNFIKGDVVSQNKAIQGMNADQLNKWLRELFLRIQQDTVQAYS